MTEKAFTYVPPSEWKTLNALDGFGQNRIQTTDALAGQSFQVQLSVEHGGLTEYSFETSTRLAWTQGGTLREEAYEARAVYDGIFLVCFDQNDHSGRAHTVVLDVERLVVTVITSTVVGDDGSGRRVDETVAQGWLPGGERAEPHTRTEEHVGHRVQYIYSPDHAYEHIYLTPSTYAWHCLAGEERGQADCDPAFALKLRERVYLLAWRERVVPCDGIVVLDWVNMRNNGRIFGWDTETRACNTIYMGAKAVPLNFTAYAPLTDAHDGSATQR